MLIRRLGYHVLDRPCHEKRAESFKWELGVGDAGIFTLLVAGWKSGAGAWRTA
jgi:hypothetical protein